MRTPKDEGASSVEYGLIAFAVAASVALAVFILGQTTNGLFTDSCDEIRAEIPGQACS